MEVQKHVNTNLIQRLILDYYFSEETEINQHQIHIVNVPNLPDDLHANRKIPDPSEELLFPSFLTLPVCSSIARFGS